MSEPPTNEQIAIVVGNARDHMRSGYSYRVAAPGPASRTAVIVALAEILDDAVELLQRYVRGLPPQDSTSTEGDTQEFLARIGRQP